KTACVISLKMGRTPTCYPQQGATRAYFPDDSEPVTLEPPRCLEVAPVDLKGALHMAKKRRKRRYSKGSGKEVEREMHRYKRGKARSGRGGRGGKVKSRKQAIAIGLSKARRKGKKVPKKRS